MEGIKINLRLLLGLIAVTFIPTWPTHIGVMGTPENPIMSYDFLYNEGIDNYLAEDWGKCVKNFENALIDWHWWKDNIIRCRRKCAKEGKEGDMFSSGLSEEEQFFETTVRSTLCLVRCKKEVFGSRMDRVVEGHIDEDFEMKKPYDYLQLCYFRLDMLKEAADASATVLSQQPSHEIMKTNLRIYLSDGEIKPETVINRELKEYGKLYIQGNTAYNNNDYPTTIRLMEESLVEYYKADDDCRLLCEKPFDQGWFPDFVSSIANHYTFTLRCKRRCALQLGNLYGEPIENFFGSYFNYLQYSYFQEGEKKKACEAVASALVVDPKDEMQLRNKKYYLEEAGAKEAWFAPREDVVLYKKRLNYEEKMMNFIETSFIFLNDGNFLEDVDEDAITLALATSKYQGKTKQQLKAHELTERARVALRESRNQFKNVSQMGITVAMTERELGGYKRMVADGFASEMKCLILAELIMLASEENSGYKGVSPHTEAEKFHGVTLGRTGLMVHAKLIGPEVLELIMDVTDHCRKYLQSYFKLKKLLYFSFTHLVCRTAKPEKSSNRSALDLSHEIHVDNCILQESGACLKIPPAYTFRDYSAILYLNEDFEGGEFIFTRDRTGASYEGLVHPKCGRMVGFSAGQENPHGVLPVLKGSRCAIGMWFTHNKNYEEIERSLAKMLLKRMED